MTRRYDATAPWLPTQAPLAGASAPTGLERTLPARTASLTSDLLVPLLQALVSGALLGGLFVVLAFEMSPDLGISRWKLWFWAALPIAAVAWFLLLWDTRKLLWGIETLTGWDLDRDGNAGKPARQLPIMLNGAKIAAAREERQRQEARDEFAAFVRLLDVHGTSLRAWEPQIGREDYIRYRDWLIDHGLARWNSVGPDGAPNERQGWTLTTPYQTIIRALE